MSPDFTPDGHTSTPQFPSLPGLALLTDIFHAIAQTVST
uniref:Uncharacterized protein n=1 Tax=Rhizobium rhizogenes TaxID=359 RepID=A0A7S4ZUM9_RHIRH|nr:hypothetical protein pC6.5b_340 [Rhizobium rhizogenes]